jgi:hypothetical protein
VIVLDTGALLSFARGEALIGHTLAQLSDDADTAAVAVTGLIEAYSLLDFERFNLLDLLSAHPAVQVSEPDGGDLPFIGGMANRTGNLAAGHTTHLALTLGAAVYTSRPERIQRVVGDEWPLFEVPGH